jgi:hypothetical protein
VALGLERPRPISYDAGQEAFMKRTFIAVLAAAAAAGVTPRPVLAHPAESWQAEAGSAQRIRVCDLLPKEEVKKHLPWRPALDQFPLEEEAIGATGSSCNYPSVFIQVLPYSQGTIDALKKKGGLETVSGIGDEAHFYNNANR